MHVETKLPPVSVGILAGGKSLRMGENKALLKIGNERMITRLIKELGDFSEVLISCADTKDYADLGVKLVTDEHREIGPIEGIRRILQTAEEEYVFICAADMPLISSDLVRYLEEFISSDYECYVAADEDHIHPLCAIYKKTVLPEIEQLIREGNYRIRALFQRVRTKYISLSDSRFDKKVVKNVNTRQDYVEIRKPLVFCVSGYSDSGKTFLIERLVNEFIKEGYSVGVCKHDGHDAYEDKAGSDTERYMKAGAVSASVFTDTRFSIHVREPHDADDIIRRMTETDSPPDVVIIEGLKGSDHPKIVLIKEGEERIPPGIKKPYICIAADTKSSIKADCPIYGRDDIRGLFFYIMKYYGLI